MGLGEGPVSCKERSTLQVNEPVGRIRLSASSWPTGDPRLCCRAASATQILVSTMGAASVGRSRRGLDQLTHGRARLDSRSTAFAPDCRSDRRSDGDRGRPWEGAAQARAVVAVVSGRAGAALLQSYDDASEESPSDRRESAYPGDRGRGDDRGGADNPDQGDGFESVQRQSPWQRVLPGGRGDVGRVLSAGFIDSDLNKGVLERPAEWSVTGWRTG